MRKLFMSFLMMATVFLMSCGSSGDKPNESEAAESLKKEIVALDSISTELEKTQEEIKNAAEDLDAALEELGN